MDNSPPIRDNPLGQILARADIWRGRQQSRHPTHTTGSAEHDALLGGGWPVAALSEILHSETGQGELEILLPFLARLTQSGRQVAIVDPPGQPCITGWRQQGINTNKLLFVRSPDQAEALWAIEQLTASGCFGLTLAWLGKADFALLRRLQLAAETGATSLLLCRPASYAHQHSPALLRLHVKRDQEGRIRPTVLKRRGQLYQPAAPYTSRAI